MTDFREVLEDYFHFYIVSKLQGSILLKVYMEEYEQEEK